MEQTSGGEGQRIADALERYHTRDLWDQWFGTVATTVPDHFESYVRILHRLGGRGEPERRWADIARARGTTVHPGVQFCRLARTGLNQNVDLDGYWQGPPAAGELDAGQLSVLAGLLTIHTATPEDIFHAVWVGWGGFEPGVGYGVPVSGDGNLAVAGGFREYFVFHGNGANLAQPPWFGDAGRLNAQSPNLAWPQDKSWCMATEIDFDSTVVGGSAELIAAVVHSLELEAVEVTPATDLSSEGDTVNM
ncbi:hypothetical protein [Arthrobacter glacialis]|nr:hypothetical protein [Arthrobacter glacialis]POH58414.1 hypothetical protein CVS28_11520 [Arthrobacter glacialis]